MKRRHMKVVAPLVLAFAAIGVAGAATVLSQAANARTDLAGGERISAAEEATVREPRRGKPTEPAADAVITAHARTTVAGETWKIVSYRAKSGALCAGVTWPGEGQEMGCATRNEWFARGPVAVSVGARQASGQLMTWETFVLSGLADVRRVQGIELVSTDCSKRDIPIASSGFFLDVTSSDLIAQGVWPYEVLAYGANGRVVQRITVKPEPPDTEAARAAGIKAPAVGDECA